MSNELQRKPCFSVSQAEEIAGQSYGLFGTAEALAGERDQNFRIDTPNGKYVLKISHPDTRLEYLELENQVIRIANTVDELQTPAVVKSIENQSIIPYATADETWHIRCLSYVLGEPLVNFKPHTYDLLSAIGQALGELDCHLVALNQNRESRRTLKWDLAQAPAIVSGAIESVQDKSKSALLAHVFEIHQQVAERISSLEKSVIQNDANDYNLLVNVDTTDPSATIGLIDFGDLTYTTTINELAICCAYVMLGKANPIDAALAVVGGYHQSRALNDCEISCLFPLMCMRLAQSVSIAAEQKHERPDDQYLTVTEQPAWLMLEQLCKLDPAVVSEKFSEACCVATIQSSPGSNISPEQIQTARKRFIAPSLSLSYNQPLKIVKGRGQYLFDESGMTYLDCVNNVCHVGHCHPHVVDAAHGQMSELNTNTRYLHPNIVRYAERLTRTFPDPLSVCFFVNSGSEANDLALRLARNFTARKNVTVIDNAYHGQTASLIDISPYKFNSRGGTGKSDHIQVVPMPDGFRGPFTYDSPEFKTEYARLAADLIMENHANGPIAAFIGESILGCGGQTPLPMGYLPKVYDTVRKLGGVCIADEVQIGFGRVGSKFWGFELYDVVPDIVTLGKPIGNGHPLAAVVTTRAIADAFHNGMEYFNTFGGNPVSCAIGMAVLDVIENEQLQENALSIGTWLIENLRRLMESHPCMGDVRGHGLFLGVEIVDNRENRIPMKKLATRIVEEMKTRRILLSTDGPNENVLKIKPPMVFDQANAERLVKSLDIVLTKLSATA